MTIKQFAELVENQTIESLKAEGLGSPANIHHAKTTIINGRKYTKVNVGSSGKYMIDKEGNIFGIKAYGQIHTGHHYGTLDTVAEYCWGDYEAVKL